jgi:hypothetical protein
MKDARAFSVMIAAKQRISVRVELETIVDTDSLIG